MKFQNKLDLSLYLLLVSGLIFCESAIAQVAGSEFETRIKGLTSGLVSVVLPAVSILGLIYAAILAAVGDANAKGRMVLVVVASVIGFLAPMIISWFQAATGG